jgi:hypothetical protein
MVPRQLSSPPSGQGGAYRGRVRTPFVVTCLVLLAAGLGLASCSTTARGNSIRRPNAVGRRATPTTTTTTTTTIPLPSAPQPSADAAADALVADWSKGNRIGALTVATPTAVSTLFAIAYPAGDATDRGCSTTFPPATCTIGPPGGANPNLPIYSFTMASEPGGWYVSGVQVEG